LIIPFGYPIAPKHANTKADNQAACQDVDPGSEVDMAARSSSRRSGRVHHSDDECTHFDSTPDSTRRLAYASLSNDGE
jgi:hypothetical protein